MLPSGHLAVSYLLSRFARVDLQIAAVASVFPDLLDKPLKLVFHLTDGGRSFGHGLPLLLLITLGVSFWKGGQAGYSWGMGQLFHLLADYPFSGYVPWFYPFVAYPVAASPGGPAILITWPEVGFDLSAVVLAVLVFGWTRRRRRTAGHEVEG